MNYCPTTMYNFSCRRILEFLRSDFAMSGFVLYHQKNESGVVEFMSGSIPGMKEGLNSASLNAISKAAFNGHCAHIVSDVTQTVYHELNVFPDFKPTSIVAVPIVANNEYDRSLLCGISLNQQNDDLIEKQALLAFGALQIENAINVFFHSIEMIKETESLTAQAFRDAMTGLLNRNGWEIAVDTTMQNGFGNHRSLSVFVVDVDGLKQLNDTQGHAAGDEAIRQVAVVLQQFFAPQGIAPFAEDEPCVARTGGDEFIALQFGCDDEDAQILMESINTELSTIGISASIGSASCRCIQKLPDAIVNADEAMYAQKKSSKSADSTPFVALKAAS